MIQKINDEVYELVVFRTRRLKLTYCQLIGREDIPYIKNVNLVLRFRKNYKRKNIVL